MALTDASGNILVTYTYDTWGNLTSDTDNSGIGLASLNPYRYAGYRFDDATGMYYIMARWYDPSTGRFLSQDPNNITPNYVYGSNNPVSYVDPSGRYNITWNDISSGLEDVWSATKGAFEGAVDGAETDGLAGAAAGAFTGALITPKVLGSGELDSSTYSSPVYGPPVPRHYVQSSDDSSSDSTVAPAGDGTGNVVKDAVTELGNQSKKVEHVLQDHHDWGKVVNDPQSWEEVSKVIDKTMNAGENVPYKSVDSKELGIGNERVKVTYKTFPDGSIKISDAWVMKL